MLKYEWSQEVPSALPFAVLSPYRGSIPVTGLDNWR